MFFPFNCWRSGARSSKFIISACSSEYKARALPWWAHEKFHTWKDGKWLVVSWVQRPAWRFDRESKKTGGERCLVVFLDFSFYIQWFVKVGKTLENYKDSLLWNLLTFSSQLLWPCLIIISSRLLCWMWSSCSTISIFCWYELLLSINHLSIIVRVTSWCCLILLILCFPIKGNWFKFLIPNYYILPIGNEAASKFFMEQLF